MTVRAPTSSRSGEDPVGNVLKWTLLAVAIVTFAMLGWTTKVTYSSAPPIPAKFVAPDGSTLTTDADIVAGKGGFQRADLMDYGSLYGMGSYSSTSATSLASAARGNALSDAARAICSRRNAGPSANGRRGRADRGR
jgi:nitric oxide reductase subunit B